ncbi:Elicitor-responsive protein 3-like protein [Drosera capensis]
MAEGKLEVLLVSAKGLENTDFLSSMDPYAVLSVRSQEQKSSVATDNGSEPEWNETFIFTISGDAPELIIKLMDKDNFSADDFVGEATIPLEGAYAEGDVPPLSYNIVKDGEFKGEIRVGLTFTPERRHGFPDEEPSYGGWKDSKNDD